jgi:hypothetical protein
MHWAFRSPLAWELHGVTNSLLLRNKYMYFAFQCFQSMLFDCFRGRSCETSIGCHIMNMVKLWIKWMYVKLYVQIHSCDVPSILTSLIKTWNQHRMSHYCFRQPILFSRDQYSDSSSNCQRSKRTRWIRATSATTGRRELWDNLESQPWRCFCRTKLTHLNVSFTASLHTLRTKCTQKCLHNQHLISTTVSSQGKIKISPYIYITVDICG